MKMTPELRIPESDERDVEPITAYGQSVDILLSMVDGVPPANKTPYYYQAVWDEADPAHLVQTSVVTVASTGARKQELYGEFYQAQFYLNEISSVGEQRGQFIWCATSPQRPDQPVKLNPQALYHNYGYAPLTIDSVATTLIEHVRSADDCITLMNAIRGRDTNVGQELVDCVNQAVVNIIYSDLIHADPSITKPAIEKIFGLVNQCQEFGQDVPRWAQGNLVSHLLRAISGRGLNPERKTMDSQTAMAVLELALNRRVISGRHAVHRVLSCDAIYSSPFATELLHEQLQHKANNRGPKNVFGVERVAFASKYIVTLLRSQIDQPANPIRNYLNRIDLKSFDQRTRRSSLIGLMKDLVVLVDGDTAVAPYVNTLAGISGALAYVLDEIHKDSDETQAIFDEKCTEVVEAVLMRMIVKDIGESALLDDDELEE